MVLLRVRDEEGVEGLGEAVPLSLRGGETLEQVVARARGRGERGVGRGGRYAATPATVSPPARCAVRPRCSTWRPGGGGAGLGRSGAPDGRAGPLQRDPDAGEPAAVAAERGLGGQGFATFKLKVGAGDDVDRSRRSGRRVGARRGSGSTPTGPGPWTRRRGRWRDGAARPRAGRAAGARRSKSWRRCARPIEVPIAADESVASRRPTPSGRVELGACDLATVKLSKVGGLGRDLEISEVIPVYLSSALDGPVGIAAAAHAAQALREGPRRRRRPRPGHPAALRRDDRLGRVRAARRPPPPARRARPRRRDRRGGARAPPPLPDRCVLCLRAPRSAKGRLGPRGPDQPKHRPRLGLGRGAGPLRGAARGPLPRLALDPAGGRAPPPAGDRADRHRRRALGRPSSRSAPPRRAARRWRCSVPPAPRRPTSTPPSARPTSRPSR